MVDKYFFNPRGDSELLTLDKMFNSSLNKVLTSVNFLKKVRLTVSSAFVLLKKVVMIDKNYVYLTKILTFCRLSSGKVKNLRSPIT